ncbi:MAG: hypothetical protein J5673_00425 [Candidatus Methanomethylophilaceae archaeon]|nr:hypothetical protein [Candidatus Methanomethylophilaceae archaeon]
MTSFTFNVISEKDDKRIPISVAGQVMVDVQDLFRHIGEYIISREMRFQEAVPAKLAEKFTIYADKSGGVVLEASTEAPETRGYGNVVEDALTLLEATLDSLGSGTGGYWMDDNFKDAIYRNQVVIDIVALYQDLNDRNGYALMYGSGSELKRFGTVNVQKMADFIGNRGMSVNGVTVGVVEGVGNKAGNSRFHLNTGDSEIKLTFADPKVADELGDGPVIVAGRINYSDEGKITSVENVLETSPLTTIKFRRIISSNGDVILKVPVDADVAFKDGKWVLSNKDLGILSSKQRWDDVVADFHDYFIFLWSEYKDKNTDLLSDEEREVKDTLNALVA